jgi:hypothetical protein
MTDYQFAYLTPTNSPGFLSAPPLDLSVRPPCFAAEFRREQIQKTSINPRRKRLDAPADFQSVDEGTVRGGATAYTRTGTFLG